MSNTEQSKPERIQLSRVKGWRMPPNAVKVDRSTLWGNPFQVGDTVKTVDGTFPITDQAMAAMLFRDLVARDGAFPGRARYGKTFVSIADMQRELRGKSLACWCRLGTPCHGDLLLELANETEGMS